MGPTQFPTDPTAFQTEESGLEAPQALDLPHHHPTDSQVTVLADHLQHLELERVKEYHHHDLLPVGLLVDQVALDQDDPLALALIEIQRHRVALTDLLEMEAIMVPKAMEDPMDLGGTTDLLDLMDLEVMEDQMDPEETEGIMDLQGLTDQEEMEDIMDLLDLMDQEKMEDTMDLLDLMDLEEMEDIMGQEVMEDIKDLLDLPDLEAIKDLEVMVDPMAPEVMVDIKDLPETMDLRVMVDTMGLLETTDLVEMVDTMDLLEAMEIVETVDTVDQKVTEETMDPVETVVMVDPMDREDVQGFMADSNPSLHEVADNTTALREPAGPMLHPTGVPLSMGSPPLPDQFRSQVHCSTNSMATAGTSLAQVASAMVMTLLAQRPAKDPVSSGILRTAINSTSVTGTNGLRSTPFMCSLALWFLAMTAESRLAIGPLMDRSVVINPSDQQVHIRE